VKHPRDMTTRQKAYGLAAVAAGVGVLLPDFANAGRSFLPSVIAGDIVKAYGIGEDLALAIAEMANDLDIDPYALANVINFESGFNPAAKNPSSSASGLIQFIESTAQRLGTSTAALRQMGAVQQMTYVRAYFAPFDDLRRAHAVAMAVFYPKAITWPSFRPFPIKVIKANGWKFYTPGGYLKLMNKGAKLPAIVPR